MIRIAIIAAMPGELKPLAKGWQHEQRNHVEMWRRNFDEGEWVAACSGAGVESAARAFAEIERDGPINVVISTGWAGALNTRSEPGRAYDVSGVIDARTGERFHAAAPNEGQWLVTSPIVADEREKRRLSATYGAALVDMEASAVARLAAQRSIPFYCIKGVSDQLTANLPDFNRFIGANGQFALARFILFVLLRPIYWPELIRMGENSKKAANEIARDTLAFLHERAYIK